MPQQIMQFFVLNACILQTADFTVIDGREQRIESLFAFNNAAHFAASKLLDESCFLVHFV
ncbi:MAG TPA: hypothetical protein EYN91_23290 [Candidatus Melainabacteria bacterium]|nr:hypothetical protein [Candidatus Melainabacteria bacterium]